MKFELVLDVDDDHPALTGESEYDLLFLARLAFNEWKGITVANVEPVPVTEGGEPVGGETLTTSPGEELAERRIRLGLTVRDLAKRSGIDRATISRAEKGTTATRGATYSALHRVLDDVEKQRGPAPAEDASGAHEVEFQVLSEDGLSVTLRGPVAHAEELSHSALRLVEEFRAAR